MKQVLISRVLENSRQDPPPYLPVILGRLLLCFILRLLISLQLITGSAIFFKPYDAIVPIVSSANQPSVPSLATTSRYITHRCRSTPLKPR